MAQNLLKSLPAQDTLTVYDAKHEKVVRNFSGPSNVRMAESVGQVFKNSEVIFTMLPESKQVATVYDSMLSDFNGNLQAPKLFLDCSTIEVSTSLRVAHLMRANGGHIFIDAPVYGGVSNALNSTLVFMVGVSTGSDNGNEADLFSTTIEPLLATMGQGTIPCGGIGFGLIAMLSRSYIQAVSNLAALEAFQMSSSLGLDLQVFKKILTNLTPTVFVQNPKLESSLSFPVFNGLREIGKDVGLTLDAAKQAEVKLFLGQTAYEAYREIEVQSGNDSIYQLLENNNQ